MSDPQRLAFDLKEIFDDINLEAVRSIEFASKEAANHARQYLRTETSLHKTGDYEQGWRVKRIRGFGLTPGSYIVHNKTRYMLTHLLENGHWNHLTGNWTVGIPHIIVARDKAEKVAQEKVEEAWLI